MAMFYRQRQKITIENYRKRRLRRRRWVGDSNCYVRYDSKEFTPSDSPQSSIQYNEIEDPSQQPRAYDHMSKSGSRAAGLGYHHVDKTGEKDWRTDTYAHIDDTATISVAEFDNDDVTFEQNLINEAVDADNEAIYCNDVVVQVHESFESVAKADCSYDHSSFLKSHLKNEQQTKPLKRVDASYDQSNFPTREHNIQTIGGASTSYDHSNFDFQTKQSSHDGNASILNNSSAYDHSTLKTSGKSPSATTPSCTSEHFTFDTKTDHFKGNTHTMNKTAQSAYDHARFEGQAIAKFGHSQKVAAYDSTSVNPGKAVINTTDVNSAYDHSNLVLGTEAISKRANDTVIGADSQYDHSTLNTNNRLTEHTANTATTSAESDPSSVDKKTPAPAVAYDHTNFDSQLKAALQKRLATIQNASSYDHSEPTTKTKTLKITSQDSDPRYDICSFEQEQVKTGNVTPKTDLGVSYSEILPSGASAPISKSKQPSFKRQSVHSMRPDEVIEHSIEMFDQAIEEEDPYHEIGGDGKQSDKGGAVQWSKFAIREDESNKTDGKPSGRHEYFVLEKLD